MCGIAGVLDRGGRVDPGAVEAMLDRIAHRGPDDRGSWTHGGLGLGHVRLSLLDPGARGHQPMLTADGSGVLAYNGEVYNFPDLRRELEATGTVFSSGTDTEVVLEALHAWGPENAVARFDGMFAFAYRDRRDGTLWLGRDRFGIKPLYLARTGTSLLFASEIKALLGHPGVACRPDVHAIVTQLVYDRPDGNWTPFEGIEPLAPGTLLRIGATEETIVWFDTLREVDPRRILSNGATDLPTAVRRFEELLDSSVRRHLRCDVPLATICSGGLDSSLITALAKDHKPDLVAYVADIAGMRSEEARRSAAVCRRLGVELRPVPVDMPTFYRLWPRSIAAGDQPNWFAQHAAALAVADALHRDGFKAVLCGDGADELFGGYSWYANVHRMWRKRRRRAARARLLAPVPFLRRLLPRRWKPDLDALAERPFTPDDRPGCGGIAGPGIAAIGGARRHLREVALFRHLEPLPLHEERAFLSRSYADLEVHLSEALRANDRMAMHRSVENRVPFLGNDLIDYALHLPCRLRYDARVSKRLVHALALRRLPEEVVRRPKIGFRAPESLWRGMAGFLRGGRLAEILRWRAADQPEILRLLEGQPRPLYRVLSLELWARIRLGGESPDELGERLLRERLRLGE